MKPRRDARVLAVEPPSGLRRGVAAAAGWSAQDYMTSLMFQRLAVWRLDVEIRAAVAAVTVVQARDGDERKAAQKWLRSGRRGHDRG